MRGGGGALLDVVAAVTGALVFGVDDDNGTIAALGGGAAGGTCGCACDTLRLFLDRTDLLMMRALRCLFLTGALATTYVHRIILYGSFLFTNVLIFTNAKILKLDHYIMILCTPVAGKLEVEQEVADPMETDPVPPLLPLVPLPAGRPRPRLKSLTIFKTKSISY